MSSPSGYILRKSVRLISTAAVAPLSGSQTVDGVATSQGDLVCLKDQGSAYNGFWEARDDAWIRDTTAAELGYGTHVYAEEGTQAGELWHITTVDPIVWGTTTVTFAQVGGGGASVGGTPANTITPDASPAAGASAEASRVDHTHGIATAAPGAITPGAAAAEGVSTSFTRADHTHSVPAFGSTAGSFCEGNDARLSDARTPTSHGSTHVSSDLVPVFNNSAPAGNPGLVPTPGSGGSSKFLREDGTWQTIAGTGTVTQVDTTAPVTGGPITTTGTIAVSTMQPSGTVGERKGLVPDPGGVSGATKYLREDATWVVPPPPPTTGVTTVDFGAFSATAPATMATATVAAPGITTSSIVRAWITPYSATGTAGTADHSADEHIIGASLIDIVIGAIDAAGETFTIYALCRDMGGSPLEAPGIGRQLRASSTAGQNYTQTPTVVGSVGGKTINTMWGKFNVAYSWS